MPSSGLDGPYLLTAEKVDEVVTQKSAGAYALDRKPDEKAFIVNRVGRSDKDVATRLKDYLGGQYKYFKFCYCSSPKAAFEKECRLYHDWDPPDNPIHPDRPEGTNWKCPVDGCDVLD